MDIIEHPKSPYTDDNMMDRYGSFYLLTALEEKGHCFWCGVDVKGGRRYCCDEHKELYHDNFSWSAASYECRERASGYCGDCGGVFILNDRGFRAYPCLLVIHHIIPLDGTFRTWNVLNRPENLIALCHSCHGKRHARLNGKKEHIMKEDRYEAAMQAGQQALTW